MIYFLESSGKDHCFAWANLNKRCQAGKAKDARQSQPIK